MKSGQAVLDANGNFAMPDAISPENHPMALLLEEIEQTLHEPRIGDIRDGIIVEKRSNELLIDIGFKSEGLVNGREIDRIKDTMETIEIGDKIPVFILREEGDGSIQLSISRAQAEKDWQLAEELMANQDIFEGEVTTHNRGGVIVKFGQVRGFVPASQLVSKGSNAPADASEEERWAHMVNENLMLKVIDIDRKRNRLILSERLAMREYRRKQKEELLSSLKEGDVFDGVITSIADFGAFVNLGGADGLIHLSELSWNRVYHPSEIVSVGDEIKVQILNIDMERKRIGLSMRRLQPQPWDVVHDNYAVGQVVRGKITKLVNFGAFARLETDGLEGLIHISELSDNRVGHPKEIVTEGEEYDLRIIRIDTDKRRMGLSLKQALPPKETVELDWQIAPSPSGNGDEEATSEVVADVVNAMSDGDDTSDEAIANETIAEESKEIVVEAEETASAEVTEEEVEVVEEVAVEVTEEVAVAESVE